jgi:transcriptional regulator with XRE-family HTH domain
MRLRLMEEKIKKIDSRLVQPDSIKIQQLLALRGWAPSHLASLANLSLRTIHRIEEGATVSLAILKALAAALNVDIDSLILPSQVAQPSYQSAFVSYGSPDEPFAERRIARR